LVAQAVSDLLNEPQVHDGSGVNEAFIAHAQDLLRQAGRVVLWWTPRRVEDEALRRAADNQEPSIIAREHHLFLALYLYWEGLFVQWVPSSETARDSTPDYLFRHSQLLTRRAGLLRDAIQNTLAIMERKAAAAEARAMDIRLRVDHQKLTAILAGQELVSHLEELVNLAEEGLSSQAHLRELVEQLSPFIEKAAQSLGSAETVADFAYDKLLAHEAAAPGKAKRILAAMTTAAFGGASQVFLEQLLRHFS
jgi:hypothetical protein